MKAPAPLPKRLRAHAQRLKQKKHRDESGCVLLEGARLVVDALEASAELEFCAVDIERMDRHQIVLREAAARGVPLYAALHDDIAHMSDTVHAQGVVAVARFRPSPAADVLRSMKPGAIITVMEGIADPGNLGTVIRSCDWFGAGGLLLSERCVDPANPKVVRATMGSLFRVPIGLYTSRDDLFLDARRRGMTVAATSAAGGVSVASWQSGAGVLLLFGSEAHGLDRETLTACDAVLTLPRSGRAESLNLAIAHAVFLSHLSMPR